MRSGGLDKPPAPGQAATRSISNDVGCRPCRFQFGNDYSMFTEERAGRVPSGRLKIGIRGSQQSFLCTSARLCAPAHRYADSTWTSAPAAYDRRPMLPHSLLTILLPYQNLATATQALVPSK
jgi:hypothetical protein